MWMDFKEEKSRQKLKLTDGKSLKLVCVCVSSNHSSKKKNRDVKLQNWLMGLGELLDQLRGL